MSIISHISSPNKFTDLAATQQYTYNPELLLCVLHVYHPHIIMAMCKLVKLCMWESSPQGALKLWRKGTLYLI